MDMIDEITGLHYPNIKRRLPIGEMPKTKDQVRIEGKPVFYAVLYNSMREAALELGYALALHGSMQSDMDLLAVAWVADAKPVWMLVDAINSCIGVTVWENLNLELKEERPFGRKIYTLSIMGSWHIDLSVIGPSDSAPPPPDPMPHTQIRTGK